MYADDDHHVSYGRSSVEDLKAAYFAQIRRDELRHRIHRSIPTPSIFGTTLSSGGFSLPNIAEAANEASENSSASSVIEKSGAGEARTKQEVASSSHSASPDIGYQKESHATSHSIQNAQDLSHSQSQKPLYFAEHDFGGPATLKKGGSKTQLLYPPGSLDKIVSEKTRADRPKERIVYENKPIPPSLIAVNISEPEEILLRKSCKDEIEEQKKETSSSLLPSNAASKQQPKSILKQPFTSLKEPDRSGYSERSSNQQTEWPDRYCVSDMPNAHSCLHGETSRIPENASYYHTVRPNSATAELQSEEDRFRIMQENLRRHRQRSATPQHRYPQTSFNGPFFRLEEVGPSHRYRSQSTAPFLSMHELPGEETHYSQEELVTRTDYKNHDLKRSVYESETTDDRLRRMKMMSLSETEITQNRLRDDDGEQTPNRSESVVVWPPASDKSRPRSASVMARNITDPDRIDEYRKQKQMELEAMRRRDEEMFRYRQKQLHAMQLQQQRLYYQQNASLANGPVEMIDTLQLSPEQINQDTDFGEPQMRVFETRPISALSESTDPRDFVCSPVSSTWKRTYVVEPTEPAAKNEILTSSELLEKEHLEVDLLKRRAAFVEKPQPQPEIFRTGKRWQPPPDQPYIWPSVRRPISVEPGHEPVVDFAPGVPKTADEGEYKWEPVVFETEYKKERKNFTPTNSPPHSPRKGMGTGPLDDVAKRQTRYLIQPSPDGSHRPKPAFGGPRATPSGGFYPHAPNAIKIVKKVQAPSSLSPNQDQEEVEIIHQRNYHRLDLGTSRSLTKPLRGHSEQSSPSLQKTEQEIADWEKIYDLPPHSSTITGKDVPKNIDVRRRLALFENAAAGLAGGHRQAANRTVSADTPHLQLYLQNNSQQYAQHDDHRNTQQPQQPQKHPHHQSRMLPSTSWSLLRRIDAPRGSAGSSRNPTPVQHQRGMRQHQQLLSTASNPSVIQTHQQPQDAQVQQQMSSTAQRRLMRIAQMTMPSPPPPSYERARPYVPPPLPPGYRRPPSTSSSAGYHHTLSSQRNYDNSKRLVRSGRPLSAGHYVSAPNAASAFYHPHPTPIHHYYSPSNTTMSRRHTSANSHYTPTSPGSRYL